MTRPSWDQYFIEIAEAVSRRGTCDRKRVGSVLVDPRTRTIVATGYNGSIPGEPHCDDVGHDLVENHCIRTTHSELNAIAQAARSGVRLDGATLYTNTFPCWPCFKALMSAGVRRVVAADAYRRDARVDAAAGRLGVEISVVQRTIHLPATPAGNEEWTVVTDGVVAKIQPLTDTQRALVDLAEAASLLIEEWDLEHQIGKSESVERLRSRLTEPHVMAAVRAASPLRAKQ